MKLEDVKKELLKNPKFAEEYYKANVGMEIQLLRRMKGLTQAQLAKIVGTKQTSISRLENDDVRGGYPKLVTLYKIAKALGYYIKIKFEKIENYL